MTSVNIIRPLDGWVLQRIAESWNIPDSKCDSFPDQTADVNIWVNYAMFGTVGKWKKTRCDIGWFTHREEGSLGQVFDRAAREMDWCMCPCKKTADLLPMSKTSIVTNAPDSSFQKGDIILGVIGRSYPRKRFGWIEEIEQIPGITVKLTGGQVPFRMLPEFYRSVDYLLVLSDNEGGPLPVVEALAMGKPVIAPDVGWCWEFPVLRYTKLIELKGLLSQLVVPANASEIESAKVLNAIRNALERKVKRGTNV